jgi:hypothetical protein
MYCRGSRSPGTSGVRWRPWSGSSSFSRRKACSLRREDRTLLPLGKISFARRRSKSRNGGAPFGPRPAQQAKLCTSNTAFSAIHAIEDLHADRANSSFDRGNSSETLWRHRACHLLADGRAPGVTGFEAGSVCGDLALRSSAAPGLPVAGASSNVTRSCARSSRWA